MRCQFLQVRPSFSHFVLQNIRFLRSVGCHIAFKALLIVIARKQLSSCRSKFAQKTQTERLSKNIRSGRCSEEKLQKLSWDPFFEIFECLVLYEKWIKWLKSFLGKNSTYKIGHVA